MRADFDVPATTRSRRDRYTAVAAAATIVAVVATVTWMVDLATRPPCPTNYVRLIDFELAAPVVSGTIMVAAAGTLVAGSVSAVHGSWPSLPPV